MAGFFRVGSGGVSRSKSSFKRNPPAVIDCNVHVGRLFRDKIVHRAILIMASGTHRIPGEKL
jgi:hypothetical protein